MVGFVKVLKNSAYFKRYQVKYRRRREGKTDYKARKFMIMQDKTKYNAAKYRLVARVTNKDIIAQVVYSKMKNDVVVAAAYSHELKNYGVELGLTNYAACYCTGLLLARRTLAKLGLADKYQGTDEVTGEYYEEADKEDSRPFKALLDVGLARTTTGARIFGVLKGAVDGGINVPHSESRFPGWNSSKEELDGAAHRHKIFGGHVADYMKSLQADDQDKYNKQFGRFVAKKIKADDLEGIYGAAHKAIKANSAAKKVAAKKPKTVHKRKAKYSLAEKKNHANQRVQALKQRIHEANE